MVKTPVALLFLMLSPLALLAETGYGVSLYGRLVEIDLESGERTILGNFEQAVVIDSLSWSADGRLFAAGREESVPRLYELSVPDGQLTPVGDLAVSQIAGLSFDASGELWLLSAQNLFRVDPEDASVVQMASFADPLWTLASDGDRLLTVSNNQAVAAIDLTTFELEPLFEIDLGGGIVDDAAVGRDGSLQLVGGAGGGVLAIIPLSLWRVDLQSESAVETFSDGIPWTLPDAGIDSLAIRGGGALTVIPTLDQWGLLAIVALLMASAIAVLRRRQGA